MPRHSIWTLCLTLAAIGFPVLSFGGSSDTAISASVAGLYVGETHVVEGSVATAQRDGNVVHLRLGTGPQALTVSLVLGLLNDFPPTPERYYVGKTVRVAGAIGSFRGTPEIVIHDAADIRLVGASAAAVAERPATGAAPEGPALRERVDTLSERVRGLEQRVQQLEHGGRPAVEP